MSINKYTDPSRFVGAEDFGDNIVDAIWETSTTLAEELPQKKVDDNKIYNLNKTIEERINNINENIKRFDKIIQDYTSQKKIKLEELNISREKIEDKIKQATNQKEYDEYTKELKVIELGMVSLIEPSKNDLLNELRIYKDINNQLDKERNNIEKLISKYENDNLKIRIQINDLHKNNAKLTEKYYKLVNNYEKNSDIIEKLKESRKKYEKLKNNLKNYEKETFKTEIDNKEIITNYDKKDLNKEIDPPSPNLKTNKKYEYVLDEKATMQNYENSGYNTNAYGWYFNPNIDEYDKNYNPINDNLFRVFNVYELVPELDEKATMQRYEFNQNTFGWYFNPWIDEYDENYSPLNDPSYQVFVDKKVNIGLFTYNEISRTLGGVVPSNEELEKEIDPVNPSNEEIPTGNDENHQDTEDEPIEEDTEDYKYSYEEAIEKLKESLIPELTDEEFELIAQKIDKLIVLLYNKEQNEFEEQLRNTNGVVNKIKLIEKREQRIKEYADLYNHNNEKINERLKAHKDIVIPRITNDYNIAKNNGQYCWKEFENVYDAILYILNRLESNKEIQDEFNSLYVEMLDIIKNPDEEKYNDWRVKMIAFANNNSLDSEKLAIYLTAEAKEINNGLSVDNEFNINGLNLNKIKEEEKGKKKNRLKVIAKKAWKWVKEHKLVTIAIGLALVGGTLMLIPQTHMMINSALWMAGNKLGFSASSLAKLNGLNQALSKTIAGGKFAYNAASGMYTLGGAAGAEALYTAGGAKLVGALEGLLVGGAVGTGLAAAIKSIAQKIKNKKAKKEKESEEKIVIPKENPESVERFWKYPGGEIPYEYVDHDPELEEVHSMGM